MGRIVRSVIRLGDPVMFMGAWGTALLIALFVLYPVFRVLAYPSATDFLAVLDHPRWLRAIVNTLVMTTLSTVTACLLGFVFALALTRPDLPGKGLFRTISILPLFSPPFAVAFSYLLLFGRLGLITHTVFHLRVDILGWRGLWLSQTISFFPIATLAISRVLENIPPSIEFVARDLGADEVSVFRTVTAPLARPGVAAAMLLVALYVLADFGNPLVIGEISRSSPRRLGIKSKDGRTSAPRRCWPACCCCRRPSCSFWNGAGSAGDYTPPSSAAEPAGSGARRRAVCGCSWWRSVRWWRSSWA